MSNEHEIRELRHHLRDLSALLALPAIWRRSEPADVVSSLGDVLSSLLRLDLVFVRLAETDDSPALEVCRQRVGGKWSTCEADVRAHLAAEPLQPLPLPEEESIHLARVNPNVAAGDWLVIAGSRRPDFPTAPETFLMRVAVEQAGIAVDATRLLAQEQAARRQAEQFFQQAEQASKAKSNFLAIMSHELRTPLNAILGYVDLLLLGLPTSLPESARGHVDRVRMSARHLLLVIEEILTFSRVDAGREQVHPEAVDVGAALSEAADLVKPLAADRRLSLRVLRPDQALEIVTDAGKLRQILLNLLSNAIKFTESGEVELGAEPDGEGVVLHVRDTGIGIDPDHVEYIFEPFRQIDQQLTRRTGGTGLGLSVSRELARLLGGEVTVTSAPGEGSTFWVRLPPNAPEANRGHTAGTERAIERLDRRRRESAVDRPRQLGQ